MREGGLDDYALSHAVAYIKGLSTLTLKSPALMRLAPWWKGWRENREAANGAAADALALLERGESVRTLHPAQDVIDGVLYYGVPAGDALVIVNSDRQVVTVDELPRGLALRHAALRESTVSRNVALSWNAGMTGSVAEALDALAAFFRTYVVFVDPRIPALLAAWTLGTWCYRAFRVFPYLSVRSPEKRCGKSAPPSHGAPDRFQCESDHGRPDRGAALPRHRGDRGRTVLR